MNAGGVQKSTSFTVVSNMSYSNAIHTNTAWRKDAHKVI